MIRQLTFHVQKLLVRRLSSSLYQSLAGLPKLLMDFSLSRQAAKTVSMFIEKPRRPTHSPQIKPVYFFGRYRFSSFKLGGIYLIEALKKSGITAASGKGYNSTRIKNAVLVTVKQNYLGNLVPLKNNNNRIIVDVRDNYLRKDGVFHPDFFGRDLADVIIFSNRALLNRFLSIGPTTSRCRVLYGYADPAIRTFFSRYGYRKLTRLHCCYFGYHHNLDTDRLGRRPDLTQIPLTEHNFNRCLKKLRDYNMHVDVNPDPDACRYKPLTKVLIAAQCRANIIIRKSPRVLELLPADYPFFIENGNIETVFETAQSLAGTPAWEETLTVMDHIREKYAFENHLAEFINILKEVS